MKPRQLLPEEPPDRTLQEREEDTRMRDCVANYFELNPVAGVLDTDGDHILFPLEMANAPAALLRLDRNRDGKLSTEKCGVSAPSMRILAALDANHDGRISAREIRNARAASRTLDKNADGVLPAGLFRGSPVHFGKTWGNNLPVPRLPRSRNHSCAGID
jgi:hypothetical protein